MAEEKIVSREEEHDEMKVQVNARYCLKEIQKIEMPRSNFLTVDKSSNKISLLYGRK